MSSGPRRGRSHPAGSSGSGTLQITGSDLRMEVGTCDGPVHPGDFPVGGVVDPLEHLTLRGCPEEGGACPHSSPGAPPAPRLPPQGEPSPWAPRAAAGRLIHRAHRAALHPVRDLALKHRIACHLVGLPGVLLEGGPEGSALEGGDGVLALAPLHLARLPRLPSARPDLAVKHDGGPLVPERPVQRVGLLQVAAKSGLQEAPLAPDRSLEWDNIGTGLGTILPLATDTEM